MRISIFLGSGVSLKTGLPNTDKITNKILNDNWHQGSDEIYYPGEDSYPANQRATVVPHIQEFLSRLKNIADQYFLSRRDTKSNYEDLYYLCQQIADNEKLEIDNPLIQPFIDQLKRKSKCPFKKSTTINGNIELGYLASQAIDLIQCAVWHSLYTDKKPSGLNFILKIIENFKYVDIATLNHDLLIENLMQQSKIDYVDGFETEQGNSQFRRFEPDRYKRINNINLFKLHGSINWYHYQKQTNDHSKESEYGISTSSEFRIFKDENGEWHSHTNRFPKFLTGSYNKMLDYSYGIFEDVHYIYKKFLKDHNSIIMSGYGWNDRGINGILFDWIYSSARNKIILLHKNPEIEIKKKSRSSMYHQYDKLTEEGKLVVVKKWMSDTNYSDISNYIHSS